jgi:hypothetical protein
MPWRLPVGLDFADGVTPLPLQPYGSDKSTVIVGTPLPTAFLQIWSNSQNNVMTVEEPPGSPDIERAEQCTCSHTLQMSWQEARYYWTLMPRGTIVNDSGANIWRILSARCKRLDATKGELSYVMESISFDSPPDEFSINEVSLDLNIIKHPRYNWALLPYITDASTYAQVGDTKVFYTELKEALVRMIQNYIETPYFPSVSQVNGKIHSSILSQIVNGKYQVHYPNPNFDGTKAVAMPVQWDGNNAHLPAVNCDHFVLLVPVDLHNISDPITIAIAATKEILTKLWRQEDTPYIAGYEVVWTQYFFAPIYLNPGGYIEDPRDWVPAYFMNPYFGGTVIPRALQTKPGVPGGPIGGTGGNNQDSSLPTGAEGASIFDALTTINPQSYSSTGLRGGPLAMSSLRKSDHVDYERTWFKVPHTWFCAPVGKWDEDLYTSNDRPQVATDYNRLPQDQTFL